MASTKKQPAPTEIRRKDYKPPVFLIDKTELDFDLDPKKTRVRSRLEIRRNPASKEKKAPFALDGEDQKLLGVWVDGRKLKKTEYELTDKKLILPGLGAKAVVEVESTHCPAKNTALLGLYVSDKLLCTQCEAEGFRHITYYPDRPDIPSSFRVTLHADKATYPVLLSNGNLVKKGNEPGGRHYTVWEDPHHKPCYLFALVAGKLDRKATSFTTMSGRKVLIEIYVDPGKLNQTAFALDAIKSAMAWDEKTYGREYDLDRFMMVAVSSFNYGAMENKGLNIFNDSCVLGNAQTATDLEISYFRRVVAHEYFHNWTGDRVTCRDWFQISLKEGLTIFREQNYCGDMSSPAEERLRAVSMLRRVQFAEDAGAMAHPVRIESYQAVDNCYSMTVYEKGAELVRMIETFVGKDGFRKGLDLYFDRHDGTAATCDDFVAAMEDANKIDLSQFMIWYEQAGTPNLDVTSSYDDKKGDLTLTVRQSTPPTPGQRKKKPLHMPFCVGLLDSKGRDMARTFILDLKTEEEIFVFKNLPEKPVLSLMRNFSAPVRLKANQTEDDLLFLMAHDSDNFNRWEAAQTILTRTILDGVPLAKAFIEGARAFLTDKTQPPGIKAKMLSLPSETELGLLLRDQGKLIDPIALYEKRQRVVRELAVGLEEDLWDTFYALSKTVSAKKSDNATIAARSLKNMALAYLYKVAPDKVLPLAADMLTSSPSMTDKIDALGLIADSDFAFRDDALAAFAEDYSHDANIMDNWLSAQASMRRPGVLGVVKKLMKHPAFDLKVPNRVYALLSVFAANPFGFHQKDGEGYRFLADTLIKLDRLNPMMSAHIAHPFLRWNDFDKKRQALMKAELKRMAKDTKLSPNLRELVQKSLVPQKTPKIG